MLAWIVALGIFIGLLPAIRWFFKPITVWFSRRHTDSLPSVTEYGKKDVSQDYRLFEPATVNISLVIPAYNEKERLPIMLAETLEYLNERKKRDPSFTYEIIVSDDGSRDNTKEVALSYPGLAAGSLFVVRREKNRGKGAAVKAGMMYARGELLLMVDADGATKISDLERLEAEIRRIGKNGLGVVVGSRNHLVEQVVAQRKWYRNILMHGLHFLVSVVCGIAINDTQCGFKLFTRESARRLFPTQHTEHWSFDVELLYLATRLSMPTSEVAVNWTEIPGSKLNVIEASLSLGRDLLLIRGCYLFGLWRMSDGVQSRPKSE
eukprot:GILI01011312.1.p1 GENE.GILI01011312.1~~GILI01011312.1.p1  ORF type:complete len:321 (+),score=87.49 GILI01011312.1:204-1166(+)